MEENKNIEKSKLKKKIIISLLIVMVIIAISILSSDRKSPNTLNDNIIVISDFKVRNPEIEGGFATVQYAILVNLEKKEKYIIDYQDVWSIHEERGNKDSVSIKTEKLSDDEISEIRKKSNLQKFSTIKQFLDTHIKSNYKMNIEK